jgi:EAL domain-containing protein (putative c-di-GMP-specific phosphodiesterase class I)/GGDEF domain-containing protein
MRAAEADAHGLNYAELLSALQEFTQPASASLAVLLFDLVDLPKLQARLGFKASTALLNLLASEFRGALGERGAVLRFGDARFCVVVQNIRNSGHATLAAGKLLRVVENVAVAETIAIAPKMHIGIGLFPLQAATAEELLRKVQLAVAAARARGQRLVVFDAQCAEQVLKPWELGEAFAQALDDGELDVYYQPKVHISTGRVTGVEALMRWLQNGQSVASPEVFIPLAEEAGLIQKTTWYALSNSLRLVQDNPGLGVAVNITPGMLHHREFVEMVTSAVSTWNVHPGGLTLEITEGSLIADFETSTARLARLRDLGVRISIDDFGTGYSSLSYFKKIPADELKIDKSFVMGMLRDDADQRLIETIIKLAHLFKLEVVAEGVEDADVLERLKTLGCGYAQGFLFAPALPAQDLRSWLQQHATC